MFVNLLLASAAGRRREFAVRAAIAAGHARLLGQLLSENVMLCALAGTAALVLAPSLARAFVALYPSPTLGYLTPGADGTMAAAAAALAVAATLALAVPQFVHVRRTAHRAGPESTGQTGHGHGFVRQALVAVQVALSIALVAAGAGLVRTVTRLTSLDPGFRAEGVLTFSLNPTATRFGSGAATLGFYRSVVDSVRGIPGVRSAAAAVGVALTSSGWQFGIRPDAASAEVLAERCEERPSGRLRRLT